MIQISEIKSHILSMLHGGDILFIVPPFITTKYPVLGVHNLQSTAEEKGYTTEVFYLNLLLASVLGRERYEHIIFPSNKYHWRMLPERLFARSAYGLPPLGRFPEWCSDKTKSIGGNKPHDAMFDESENFDLKRAFELEEMCNALLDEVIPVLNSLNYKIIGCTARTGQINCSIALLNGMKRLHPDTITVIGGASCEGEMAQGMASLSDSLDYIFSGESEESFDDFLTAYSIGRLPSERIISGTPCIDLDSLSLPYYRGFFRQTECFLGEQALQNCAVSYETSRGCWWGEKQQCHFCGNKTMVYRKKTGSKVLNDLSLLSQAYPNSLIYMCDNIMPASFPEELCAARKEQEGLSSIYYLTKANLELKDLIDLKALGVEQLTAGIEALSDGLLKLMRKGVTARQNVQLLRNTRSVGIALDWLLLWGLPGDKIEHYEETLELLPLLRHLQPPVDLAHLYLVRFSPYLQKAQKYHIEKIRPWAVYHTIYPEWADVEKLAVWFRGEYPCKAHQHPQLIAQIAEEMAVWKKVWKSTYVVMVPCRDYYLIVDNRGLNKKKQYVLNDHEAKEIMTAGHYTGSEYQTWVVEKKLGVVLDSWYVPLVTAAPEVLLEF